VKSAHRLHTQSGLAQVAYNSAVPLIEPHIGE
jgi:hypothetical protein